MRRERFGRLDAVITGGSDRQGGGSGPVVVLLHGFGAPGTDLVGLWRYLRVPESVRFVFPAAPLELEGMFDARAWWMVDMDRYERAIRTGDVARLVDETPVGIAEARAQVVELLDAVEARLGVEDRRLVIGGFSQGAMLSCDVALHTGRTFAGVVLLSGALISAGSWRALMPAQKALPVFQSHGTHDPILPFAAAAGLRDALRAAGLSVDWNEFQGQHEIPPAVLDRLGAFLTPRLS